MNTKTETQNRVPSTDHLSEPVLDECTGGACPLGVCSPCLIVWGLLAMLFIITALVQAIL